MLRFLTAGESHGPCLVAIIEGIPAGLPIDIESINTDLARRQKGYGRSHRMRIENDQAEILSGVIRGHTTGAPIALRIENRDWANWKEKWENNTLEPLTIPRPGHADYPGMVKYRLKDARPILERASARETAARVAVGAIAKQLLRAFGIQVGSFVLQIGSVRAEIPDLPYPELWGLAEASEVRCPNETATALMKQAIDEARRARDTLGGIFEVQAINVPVGLGSHVHWDRRLDSRIAAAMMSIQAIKGVEIGSAFENASLPGTRVHDDLFTDGEGNIVRRTNRAGGIEGGISNGAPIVVRAAMKPIATTATPHASVDLATLQPAHPVYQRSDICAVPAASVIGEAMLAWVLAEALIEKYGGDSLEEMQR